MASLLDAFDMPLSYRIFIWCIHLLIPSGWSFNPGLCFENLFRRTSSRKSRCRNPVADIKVTWQQNEGFLYHRSWFNAAVVIWRHLMLWCRAFRHSRGTCTKHAGAEVTRVNVAAAGSQVRHDLESFKQNDLLRILIWITINIEEIQNWLQLTICIKNY